MVVESMDYMDFELGDHEPAVRRRPPEPRTRDEVMRTRLATGAATALTSDNKGFQLLQAMGYEEGKGIGKRPGQTTPILPDLEPQTRSGLGMRETRQRAADARDSATRDLAESRRRSFRANTRDANVDRSTRRAARRARHAVRDLDERGGIAEHDLWPQDDDDSDATDLRSALAYLRDVHGYSLSLGEYLANYDGEHPPTLDDDISALLDESLD